jgi:Skp family chaperone for outer membrane proteins
MANPSLESCFETLKRQKELLQQAQAFKGQKPSASLLRSRQQLDQEFMQAVSTNTNDIE